MAVTQPKPTESVQPTEVAETHEGDCSDAQSESETGTFKPNFDPERVKALRDEASSDDLARQERLGVNPYHKVSLRGSGSSADGTRRSLDDMRRLSKEIQAKKVNDSGDCAKAQSHSEQLRRLLEIGPLRDPGAASHGLQLLRLLTEQAGANEEIVTASAEIEALLRILFGPTDFPDDEVMVQIRADLDQRIALLEKAVVRER